MKKAVSLILALVMAWPLYGCVSPKTVELTVENFTKYLSIDRVTEKEDVTWGSVTLYTRYKDTITLTPVKAGTFENVELSVNLVMTYSDAGDPEDFSVEGATSFDRKDGKTGWEIYTYTMNPIPLSEDGTAEANYTLKKDSILGMKEYTYQIVDVSGTYTG